MDWLGRPFESKGDEAHSDRDLDDELIAPVHQLQRGPHGSSVRTRRERLSSLTGPKRSAKASSGTMACQWWAEAVR